MNSFPLYVTHADDIITHSQGLRITIQSFTNKSGFVVKKTVVNTKFM